MEAFAALRRFPNPASDLINPAPGDFDDGVQFQGLSLLLAAVLPPLTLFTLPASGGLE